MTSEKKKQLREAYDAYIEIMLSDFPLERIGEFVADDVMGYGTTLDEQILDISRLRQLAEDQRHQGNGMNIKFNISPLHRRISPSEDSAIFVDEVDISMIVEGEKTLIPIRLSSVFEIIENKWKLVHLHGSKAVETVGDTWHLEEWKQKNEVLQELVNEKTAELSKQNRELETEAALERIRTHVTAMKESSDLLDIVVTMNAEFKALGHEAHYFWHMRWLPDKYEKAMTSGDGSRIGMVMELPRGFHENTAMIEWEQNMEPVAVFTFDVNGAIDYVDKMTHLGRFSEIDHNAPGPDDIRTIGGLTFVMARTTHGEIGYSLPGVVANPPKEDLETLARFAGVFDLAYRRFEDLKSAERQNRETQIELALEKVRARTMAMHNSQDVGATVVTLFDEVLKLGLDKSIRCGIGILNKETKHMETWSATSSPNGEVDLKMGLLDMTIHPMLVGLKNAWDKGEECYSYDYFGDDVIRYYKALNDEPEYPFHIDLESLPENEYHKSFFYPDGILFSFAPNPISEEAASVLNRFAGVFGQTYRRYLDLLKAEAQAREAQIEAALERVRSKAMAMYSSEDLGLTVDAFFSELKGLNVSPHRCGVGIVDGKTKIVRIQAIDTNPNQDPKKIVGDLKLAGHPVLDRVFESWVDQKEYFPVLRGTEILEYYKVMNPQVAFHDFAEYEVQYGYYFYFKEGGVYAWTDKELQEQDIQIFRRYTSVLSLTYRRYLDLKEAEAQASEAIKQASLDRVHGQIASMRSTDDLQRITPLIWRELETLEVPFSRCGVFIINELISEIQIFLTTPEGKPLGILNLPFDSNKLTQSIAEYWSKKAVFTIHWNKNDFVSWMQSMIDLGQIKNKEEYQGNAPPPENLELHFIPFAQGMLYVGNHEPLPKDKIDLVELLAEAFAGAYSRYEDFKQLEEAKNKIEITLHDLKSTQSQLIHAEKMASLGELTAGIAHEIQNPLNFVNNFSEVSVDMMEDLSEELDTGNLEEINAITNDLKQNLEKIQHHGERASNIVKAMLEHSRTESGEKEFTDINALSDEYLRLAYHGLKAKNKSFNADFITEFDENLPLIEVVPQDIGRVLLNLINNAFYAVSEASAKSGVSYKPLVIVSTVNVDNKIQIRVHDNGNGIPAEVIDKIFQPFFTTKPTGKGTGLGLSMSYDIITKGHGGELKVETKEGDGTDFIIVLPGN